MNAAVPQARLGKRKPPPAVKSLPLAPDWAWIKRRFRTGRHSIREIARESTAKGRKVSHEAIAKRIRKEGWEKDLSEAIRARVGAELAADSVDAVDRSGASDAEIVDAAARQGADVVRSHRNDINKLRGITNRMADELSEGSEQVADLVEVIERGTRPQKGDDAAKVESLAARRERLMRMVGLAHRAGVLKDLTQSQRHLIGLERQAWNLNDKEAATPDSIEARLAALEDD